MRKTSVYIETMGCQMNVADTERAATHLRAAGYDLTPAAADADVVLLNTCSVRARAEKKVFQRVSEVRRERRGRAPLIGVLGCVAQLEGEALFDQSPLINIVAGTRATDRLPQLLARALGGERHTLDLGERAEGETWSVAPAERHSPYVAFLPIIEGCNKFCSYCIVPFSRGRERSRTAREIVAEVRELKSRGVREVHLIGQNVNSYRPQDEVGLEDSPGATPFSRLLRAVAATGIERVRYTTSFPRDFHTDIVAAMEERMNLCDWVHLPAQSGSDRVLKAMRRGYKAAEYKERVAAIKGARRRLALTSDIIVGFPGESAADFAETLRLVEHCQYDSLYIFKYSERPGTPAAKLADGVTEEEKRERFLALEAAQMRIQSQIYASFVGQTVQVLVEGESARSKEDATGHTTCNKVVNFAGEAGQLKGRTVQVRIERAKTHSLYGVLAAAQARAGHHVMV